MACPQILQGYGKPCRDVQAGTKKFYITEHANIAYYVEASGVLTSLSLNVGKQFWLYEQEPGVASGVEAITANRQNGTTFIAQTFTAKLNKRSASQSYALRALSQQDVCIIEVERTGEMFIYGLVNGLSLDPSESTTGVASGDHNGYNLIWKGEEPMLAPTVSQAILDTVIV